MTDKPENPQAYPVGGMISPSGDYYQDEYGMTLRDYFAGQALIGLCIEMTDDMDTGNIPKACYLLANAMLAERAKS